MSEDRGRAVHFLIEPHYEPALVDVPEERRCVAVYDDPVYCGVADGVKIEWTDEIENVTCPACLKKIGEDLKKAIERGKP